VLKVPSDVEAQKWYECHAPKANIHFLDKIVCGSATGEAAAKSECQMT